MANIMINKVCNLQCPYCFANKFVNRSVCTDENNITIENFKEALKFATYNNPNVKIGIIGGEPTLHPDLKKLVNIALENKSIRKVVLFTNGINMDKCIELVQNPKFNILLNMNSCEDIGKKSFKKMCENINLIKNNATKYNNSDCLSLGINFYDPNKNYDFILDEAQKLGLHSVRLSVVVPNTSEKENQDSLEYFRKFKESLFQFFNKCDEREIIPFYDCNNFPVCLWDTEELQWLNNYVRKYSKKYNNCSNLLSLPHCEPVIDILPSLEAVRCFGCSNLKVKIIDFKDIHDLRNFFCRQIDHVCSSVFTSPLCAACYQRHTLKCSSGCLAFKHEKTTQLRAIADFLCEKNFLKK